MTHAGGSGERGSIAILALWGVALIALLLIAASLIGRGEGLIARNALAASHARLAAEAGTQIGLARLLRRHQDGAAVFDGTAEVWQDGSVGVRIGIADEAGKIDLNEAPLDLLSGLFAAVGRPRDEAVLLACDVIARRGDTDPACPPTADGAGSSASYRFRAPEELAELPGFDDALYARIADCVTVATGASAIDPLVAPRTVLLALPGATASAVDSFLSERAMWRDLGAAAAEAAGELLSGTPYLMASPRRDFTVTAVATTAAGARFRADLQVRLTAFANHPYEVLAWREPPAGRGASPPAR